jgi:hypothetical protein
MVKTFIEYRLPNKDYAVIIRLEHYTLYFTYQFNSISGTYMGLSICNNINSIRGVLRLIPDFFERLDDYTWKKDLLDMGFNSVEPTEKDLFNISIIYKTL